MAVTRSQNRDAALAAAVTRSQKRKAAVLREPVTSTKALSYLAKRIKPASRTSKPFSSSVLGKLPAELRNRIYDLSLEDLPDIVNLRHFEQPAITRACKQLRSEYLPMVSSRLAETAWEISLPYCVGKRDAEDFGLKHPQDFWQRATLPWLRHISRLRTTQPVTFVASYVHAGSKYGRVRSDEHKEHVDSDGEYCPDQFHTSVRGAKAMTLLDGSRRMKRLKQADTVRLADVKKVVERFGHHFWKQPGPQYRGPRAWRGGPHRGARWLSYLRQEYSERRERDAWAR
ncbi:hypothetical protein LTR36_006186 [Oleoguttula mirabilis]|uniref:F-box domain-containing protein n=1 Tax=Oleoguttula mirabilis TaxID=1507867 RepID=A0AAV9JDA9_9PEZI|nr:hypothetical protein LTR36_006186 [Oleoguttula mirabilis]